MSGKFYVFEGIDGAGKTTQAQKLHSFLKSRNILTSLFREPGGTPVGEQIRNILLSKNEFQGGMKSETEFLLFAASRSELSKLIISPLLNQQITVLLDRFTMSSVAYQGYGRGVDLDFIRTVNTRVTEGVTPDRIFLFDLDPELALARVNGGDDRMEKNGLDFFHRVREGYLKEATDRESCTVLDASQDVDAIFDQILAVIERDFQN